MSLFQLFGSTDYGFLRGLLELLIVHTGHCQCGVKPTKLWGNYNYTRKNCGPSALSIIIICKIGNHSPLKFQCKIKVNSLHVFHVGKYIENTSPTTRITMEPENPPP